MAAKSAKSAKSAKDRKKDKDLEAAFKKLRRRLAKLDLEITQIQTQLHMYPLCHRLGKPTS